MRLSKIQAVFSVLLVLTVLASSPSFSYAAPKSKTSKATPVPTSTPTATPTSIPTPSSTLLLPSQDKQVLGFTTYYYTGDKSSYNSMTANSSALNTISTATHTTDGYGNITGLIPTEQITFANNSGIIPTVMIGNNFDGNIAKTLLENPTNRQTLINNLISIINASKYKGVNIDLEGVFYTNRNDYTTFMSEVYCALKPLGYIVSASVPAKTKDVLNNPWNGAYDYAAIANYTDFILLMTYDEHSPGGSPGAIASINWVTDVINYSLTVIPKEKIYLGVAAYGYDWYGTTTKAYSINGCNNLASSKGVQVQWDDVSQSPYFGFTDSTGVVHSVWFENGQSLGYKLDLVNSYELKGIGIWRLGLENSDYWSVIRGKLGK